MLTTDFHKIAFLAIFCAHLFILIIMTTEQLQKAVEQLAQKKKYVTPVRVLKSGKEAQVVVVADNHTDDLYALKLYHDVKTRSFQTQKHYLEDRYIGDGANIRRAIKKGNDVGKNFVQETWVMREQFFLKKIGELSEFVPKLIAPVTNGVLMTYIGDEEREAPRMSEIDVPEELKDETGQILISLIDLFLSCGIIHGDLSPFNILWWKDYPYVIDFPQAVDVRETKRPASLLHRDVKNTLVPLGYTIEEVDDITEKLLERHSLPLIDGSIV